MSACLLASVQIFDLFKHVRECRGEKIEPMKLYRACHRRSGLGGLGGLGGWPPSSLLLLLRWLPPPQNGCASFLKYLLFKPPKVFNKSHTRTSSLFFSILLLPFFSNAKSLPPPLICGWSCGQVAVMDKQTEIRSSVATNANTEHSDIGDPRV